MLKHYKNIINIPSETPRILWDNQKPMFQKWHRSALLVLDPKGSHGKVICSILVFSWKNWIICIQLLLKDCINPSHRQQPSRGVLKKICSKFIRERSCRSVVSIKLLIEIRISIQIALRHAWSPANMLDIFRKPFYKNASGGLHLVSLVSFYTLWKHQKRLGSFLMVSGVEKRKHWPKMC